MKYKVSGVCVCECASERTYGRVSAFERMGVGVWERKRERTEKDCACVFTQSKFSLRPFQRSAVDTTSRYQLPPVNDELNNVNC